MAISQECAVAMAIALRAMMRNEAVNSTALGDALESAGLAKTVPGNWNRLAHFELTALGREAYESQLDVHLLQPPVPE